MIIDRIRGPLLGLTVALSPLGCGGDEAAASAPSSSSTTGGFSGRTPEYHRDVAAACASERPASNAGDPGSPCAADADCAQGTNGRCVFDLSKPASFCSYDECAGDADCGTAQICDCRNPTKYNANTCFHGACQLDADCGAGGFCSPSAVTIYSNCMETIPPGAIGYFCHTPSDQCLDDGDCPEPSPAACIFSVDELRWVCTHLLCTK